MSEVPGNVMRCCRCSHEWTPRRAGVPSRCPRCRSVKWNEPGLEVRCLRCGNTWVSRNGMPNRCPGCGSYRWNEPPEYLECRRCGKRWKPRGKWRPSRCPGCMSKQWDVEPGGRKWDRSTIDDELKGIVGTLYRSGKSCMRIAMDFRIPYGTVIGIVKSMFPDKEINI